MRDAVQGIKCHKGGCIANSLILWNIDTMCVISSFRCDSMKKLGKVDSMIFGFFLRKEGTVQLG